MAYAGASLPLLVLFTLSSRHLGDVLTSEIVGQEIVRTLVGSVGLVAAVPITTALAAFVADRSLHREPVPALLYDGEGSASHVSARSARRRTEAAEVVHVAAGAAERQAEDEGGQGGGRPGHAVSGVRARSRIRVTASSPRTSASPGENSTAAHASRSQSSSTRPTRRGSGC